MGQHTLTTREKQLREQQMTTERFNFEDQVVEQSRILALQRRQEDPNAAPGLVYDEQRSYALLESCKERMVPQHLRIAAAGTPQQVAAQKKKGWKEKREEKKNITQMQKVTGSKQLGATTCDMSFKIKDSLEQKSNSIMYLHSTQNQALVAAHNVDTRVAKAFCKGYKQDKHGEPLNDEEAKKQLEDKRFLDSWISGDVQQRAPYLKEMTNDLLAKEITPAMLKEEYIISHIGELHELSEKLTCFQNIYNDPINRPYFNSLEPVEKDLIENRILGIYSTFGVLLDTTCKKYGLDFTKGNYIDDCSTAVDFGTRSIDGMRSVMEQTLSDAAFNETLILEKYHGEVLMVFEQKHGAEVAQKINAAVPKTDSSTYHTGDAAALERLKKAMKGDGTTPGALAEADRLYEEEMKKEKPNLEAARSMAKEALGLRSSGTEMAKADMALRGNIFDSLGEEYEQFAKSLVESAPPFFFMNKAATQKNLSKSTPAKVSWGGGSDVMLGKVVDLLESRLRSDAMLEYMQNTYDIYGQAKMFENNVESFVWFQLQAVLTNLSVGTARRVRGIPGADINSPAGIYLGKVFSSLLGISRAIENEGNPAVQETLSESKELRDIIARVKAMGQDLAKKIKTKDTNDGTGREG